MNEVFVRSHFVAKDQASYEQALATLLPLAKEAESEAHIKGFAVCAVNESQKGLLPTNDDPLTIMVVERYAETNVSRKPISIDPSLFKAQTTVVSSPVANLTRSTGQAASSYIITASFLYQIGLATAAVEGWTELVAAVAATEEQTYNYSVFQSLDTLSTFEVYSDTEYVANVHLKGSAIGKNNEHNGAWRVKQGIYATRWHLKGGFLYRD